MEQDSELIMSNTVDGLNALMGISPIPSGKTTDSSSGNNFIVQVPAGVNNISAPKSVTFTADSSTEEILSNNITILTNNSPANGVTQNRVKAVVTDARGNLVPYANVAFKADRANPDVQMSSLTADGKS